MFEDLIEESFAEREERILQFWESEKVFQRSVESRKGCKPFTFYDGPPFATGLPHYGHLLAGTIKDVVPRYKTMKGYFVPRRFGWDCHGLPVEQEIEKAFNLSGAQSIEAFGISKFNEECRKIVLRYAEEWKVIVARMGRWVDFERTYRTMDLTFMESVFWVFKRLYDAGLVYEGVKVMPFSAKLGTPLSNFEAGENYKEVDDPAITVAFPLIDDPSTSFLIWTTTPWTLISNLAILAGPEIDYVKIQEKERGSRYWLSERRLENYFVEKNSYEILERKKGKALAGIKYQPLFPYFSDKEGSFRVILEEGVSLEEGTGLVHAAPAFGEVDFYACQREGIPLVCPVDSNGRFTEEVPEYAGLFVKDADKDIIKKLKERGRLYRYDRLRHRYPFCWRSDTPLIYKAVNTWFIAVEKIKDKMLQANEKIHWTPSHLKKGRFGKWLEGARDWAISRSRYWGTPIPIWRADDGEVLCLGSLEELKKLSGKEKIEDLHRHFIDEIPIRVKGKLFRRIPEVFDCWFESGSMPYAQIHYPFENQELFEKTFPADFIAEGVDQTRGWFYTLTILAAALFDEPAFKNVVVNGILLAADGSKMSKRLRNYPDPMEVVHRHGADAIRLYMLNSPAVKGDDLCFNENGVELVLRQVLIPLWNAYSFFLTYANVYQWRPQGSPQGSLKGTIFERPEALLDRWMISQLNKLIHEVEEGMDEFDLAKAVEPFVGFVDQLTNWYIRRSRRRFWAEEDSKDRQEAFATLYRVLIDLTKIAAPFIPFLAEAIYLNLKKEEDPLSVHLANYPSYHPEQRDIPLEEGMALLQTVVSLGHSLRKEHQLKVRQPLPLADIACKSKIHLQFLEHQQHLIAEELNVKKVVFYSDDSSFVTLRAKPNFRVLGKKVGKGMKEAEKEIVALSYRNLERLFEGNPIQISLGGNPFTLAPEDVQVERLSKEGLIAATSGEVTIALDTTLNDSLILEGLAREIVNKVNTMRRDSKFSVSDRIKLEMNPTPKVQEAFQLYSDWITSEVLAKEVVFGPCQGISWDLNGEKVEIAISRVFGT